ncbi:tripartite tricarboxylate transporter TctB family protein [Intestinibacillus massiliensis]|uniref:tripartite tricarboxylate transporter TctB family protein n=1 Tax=Intestinibacillus massiliensis TaxID=1871029 RepID=UPI000B35F7BB|nr:tripartite tricarboxylate transporter TctB family protein [Intestinibacillus massiliensis]MCB6366498.1 tripartite tricarboxylate transporter TctB family protein [Intestinibacillus massiliensis]
MSNNENENKGRTFTLTESKADLVLGVFFLVFSLVLLFAIIPSQVMDVGKGFPNPRSFPNFCGYAMLVLSICMLYQSYRKRGKQGGETVTFTSRGIKMSLLALAVLIVSVVLLQFLPYIPVTIALLAGMMLLLGQRNKFVIAGVSIILPILVYVFFTYGLKLVLP